MTAKSHILIVDDEAPMRGLLKDFLESQGYEVSCYASAAMALKSIQQRVKTDAVIADVRMSPMTGIDFLKLVKNEAPSLPVFLFTAAGTAEEQALSLDLGASKYLQKPFPLIELKSWLEQVLKKKTASLQNGKPKL